MPEIIEWPGNLVITDRGHPQLISNTRSGGRALSGSEQIVAPTVRIWNWKIQVEIFRADHLRALSVMLDSLDGRYGYLRINMCDTSRVTRRMMGAVPYSGPGVPHDDGAYFSDGAGYDLTNGVSNPAAAGNANDTTLAIDFGDVPMIGGAPFSINGWLYRIQYIEDPADLDAPGTIRTVRILPPLRSDVTPDDEIHWRADVIWRLTTDDQGQAFLRLGKFGTVTIDLTEPISREEI